MWEHKYRQGQIHCTGLSFIKRYINISTIHRKLKILFYLLKQSNRPKRNKYIVDHSKRFNPCFFPNRFGNWSLYMYRHYSSHYCCCCHSHFCDEEKEFTKGEFLYFVLLFILFIQLEENKTTCKYAFESKETEPYIHSYPHVIWLNLPSFFTFKLSVLPQYVNLKLSCHVLHTEIMHW